MSIDELHGKIDLLFNMETNEEIRNRLKAKSKNLKKQS